MWFPRRFLLPWFCLGVALAVPAAEAGASFEQCRAQHFTSAQRANPAISGPDADPDQDGRTNLLEYTLGTDPRVADASAAGSFGADLAGTGHLTLRYPRQKAADDLIHWVDVKGSVQPDGSGANWLTGSERVGFAGHWDAGAADWVTMAAQRVRPRLVHGQKRLPKRPKPLDVRH